MEALMTQYFAINVKITHCLIMIDTSASMRDPVESPAFKVLNAALESLYKEINSWSNSDVRLSRKVRIASMMFRGDRGDIKPQFAESVQYHIPGNAVRPVIDEEKDLFGGTPLVEALQIGIASLHLQQKELTQRGVGISSPLIIVITDGEPTDCGEPPNYTQIFQQLAERIRRDIASRNLTIKIFVIPHPSSNPDAIQHKLGYLYPTGTKPDVMKINELSDVMNTVRELSHTISTFANR